MCKLGKEKTTREIMDKIYEMTPEEVSRFLADNFRRMCSKPNEHDAAIVGGEG